MPDTFAATPLFESVRCVFLTGFRRVDDDVGRKLDTKLLVLDGSRAPFHPPAVRELYVTVLEEDATTWHCWTTSSNTPWDARRVS